MSDPVVVSVVVCTRNRAAGLRATLAALAGLIVPADVPAEVIVADNGSTDDTAEVVRASDTPRLPTRRVLEPAPGQARARNTALGAARGRVILFTDDDVRPPADWLGRMVAPILAGAADAVAGGVRLAPSRVREWMQPEHRAWLASTEFLDPSAPEELVGASMAFGRHVLDRVPAFDPELGPGALGQGDDALFGRQLRRAGYRIGSALDVVVEHDVDPRRLLRAGFHDAARRRGRTLAYLQHHWEHRDVPDVARRRRRALARYALMRVARWRACAAREGMPAWEMFALERLAFLRHWPLEARRARGYERLGLVKHRADGSSGSCA